MLRPEESTYSFLEKRAPNRKGGVKSLYFLNLRSIVAWLGVWSFFLSFSNSIFGQDEGRNHLIRAEAVADKKSIAIGDKILYKVVIHKKKSVLLEIDDLSDNFSDFSIRDFGIKKSSAWGGERIVYWYLLDTFTAGSHTIAQALIKYKIPGSNVWQELKTQKVTIGVKSLLDKGADDQPIRDIKGPLDFPSNNIPLLLILTAVVLSGLGYLGFYRFRKARKNTQAVSKSAFESAFEQLEALRNKNLADSGRIKDYYIEISDIVRRYLENRFGLNAPEMTTEEFLTSLKDSSLLIKAHKELLGDFLASCDLVKFARYSPQAQEIGSAMKTAVEFLQQTKDGIS